MADLQRRQLSRLLFFRTKKGGRYQRYSFFAFEGQRYHHSTIEVVFGLSILFTINRSLYGVVVTKERKSENIENRPTEAKKRIFFLFGQKNPFGYLFSEMTSKGSISFSFLPNLQNLKIRPQGLQRRPSTSFQGPFPWFWDGSGKGPGIGWSRVYLTPRNPGCNKLAS